MIKFERILTYMLSELQEEQKIPDEWGVKELGNMLNPEAKAEIMNIAEQNKEDLFESKDFRKFMEELKEEKRENVEGIKNENVEGIKNENVEGIKNENVEEIKKKHEKMNVKRGISIGDGKRFFSKTLQKVISFFRKKLDKVENIFKEEELDKQFDDKIDELQEKYLSGHCSEEEYQEQVQKLEYGIAKKKYNRNLTEEKPESPRKVEKDIKQEKIQKPEEVENAEIGHEDNTVYVDIINGKYTYTNNGQTIQMQSDATFLKRKEAEAYKKQIIESINVFATPDKKQLELKKIKGIDLNLFKFYQEIDAKIGTNHSGEYIRAFQEDLEMPTGLEYNEEKDKEEEHLDLGQRIQYKNIAKTHEKKGLAELIRDEKQFDNMVHFGLRSAILGAVAIAAAMLLGKPDQSKLLEAPKQMEQTVDNNSADKDTNLLKGSKYENKINVTMADELGKQDKNYALANPNGENELETLKFDMFKNSLRVTPQVYENIDETVKQANKTVEQANKTEQSKKQEIIDSIGIGSATIIEDLDYTADSEGHGPTGNMKNREDKQIKIEYISVIGKDGRYIAFYDKTSDVTTIKEIQKQYPDNTIKVHLETKNDEKQYGWASYEEIKEKFYKSAMRNVDSKSTQQEATR